MEVLIAILLIAMTIIFFLTRANNKAETAQEEVNQKNKKPTKLQKEKETSIKQPVDLIKSDNKDCLINTFREVKEMKNLKFLDEGKTIVFSDDKRIIIGHLNNFTDKNFKFISKSLEADTISDLVYCRNKNIVAVALKQDSRDIIFYQIIEDENKKQKLTKVENKIIKSNRKFGIKHLSISKDGNYIASSGTDQDTVIQVFDVSKCNMIESIDTNEINNIDLKFSPCDNYLTVSTYMYEIAVMEFKRTIKFNKAINGDETTLKITRNKSIGGIKLPIVTYEFSNDNRYFVVSCDNGTLKILHNLDAIENSKVVHEITVDKDIMKYAENVSLLVASSFNGKLKGYLAASNNRDILVYNLDGQLEKKFLNCHDHEIIGLKLASHIDGQFVLVSGSRDGKFHVWKI